MLDSDGMKVFQNGGKCFGSSVIRLPNRKDDTEEWKVDLFYKRNKNKLDF